MMPLSQKIPWFEALARNWDKDQIPIFYYKSQTQYNIIEIQLVTRWKINSRVTRSMVRIRDTTTTDTNIAQFDKPKKYNNTWLVRSERRVWRKNEEARGKLLSEGWCRSKDWPDETFCQTSDLILVLPKSCHLISRAMVSAWSEKAYFYSIRITTNVCMLWYHS